MVLLRVNLRKFAAENSKNILINQISTEPLCLEIERGLREIERIRARTARFLKEAEGLSEAEQLFLHQLQDACQEAKAQAEAWIVSRS